MSQVFENRMELALPNTMSIVREPLGRVENMLVGQLQSDVPIIDEMVRCGGATGGKRFRPMLLLLAAQANGGIDDHHIMLATAVEMIHAATLVHDDIIDSAVTRRHKTTINNRWGNQGAVLFGDYLFTQAFYLASLTGSAEACQVIGAATNRVCQGELQQSDAAGNFETTVDDYYQIISRKTAALCGCATQLGAFSATDSKQVNQWYEVGMKLGLAFQIIDDVLDYTGDPATCGKTLGTDLETAKPTLPILLALHGSSEALRVDWIDRLGQGNAEVEDVLVWLKETGAISESLRRGKLLVKEAVAFTDQQGPNVSAAFQEMGQFLMARSH